MSQAPSVLIIDDHPLFRDALRVALDHAFPDGATAREAGSLAEARAVIADAAPDLVTLDLNLGDTRDFEALNALVADGVACPVVVVSATESASAFTAARALGAAGYLPKSLTLEELSAALVTVLDGGEWFPEASEAAGSANGAVARIASLTPTQRRVLAGLSDGLLNKQIAHEMDISVATVKAHMTAIFRKLGAQNRTQALLVYHDALSAGGPSTA